MSSSLPQACTGLVGRNPGAGDAQKVRRRPKTSPRKQLSSGCWPEVPDPTAGEGGRGGLGKPGGGSWGILTPPPPVPSPQSGAVSPPEPGRPRVAAGQASVGTEGTGRCQVPLDTSSRAETHPQGREMPRPGWDTAAPCVCHPGGRGGGGQPRAPGPRCLLARPPLGPAPSGRPGRAPGPGPGPAAPPPAAGHGGRPRPRPPVRPPATYVSRPGSFPWFPA